MLQVSKLIEDDPQLASQFASALRLDLDASLARSAEELCDQHDGAEVTAPTKEQLRQTALAAALPFVGFGLLDNAVMIACGDIIDVTLCATFGFSTMAAAALGNTFSDGLGVYSGAVVEDMASKAGFEAPLLSRAQQALDVTKKTERLGQLVGITIGCLLGMFPLLLIDQHKPERLKREKMMNEMYEHVVIGVEELLDAEAAILMLVDEQTQELYTRSAAHHGDQHVVFRSPIGEGIMGHVVRTGRFLNIQDLKAPQSEEFYVPARHDNYRDTGIAVRSVLCMPILSFDKDTGRADKVVGVVEVINKKSGKKVFTTKDEDALAAVSSHISSSLGIAHGEEHGFNYALEVCRRALWTKGTRINRAQNVRVHDMYVSVLKEVARMQGVESVELMSVRGPTKELVLLATNNDPYGTSYGYVQKVRKKDKEVDAAKKPVAPSRKAAMEAVETGKPVILDVPAEPAEGAAEGAEAKAAVVGEAGSACPPSTAQRNAVLCCPIFDTNQEVIGVMQVSGKKDGTSFSEDDNQFLLSLGREVSIALEGTGSILHRVQVALQSVPSGHLKEASPLLSGTIWKPP